jgi:hypothetical protein
LYEQIANVRETRVKRTSLANPIYTPVTAPEPQSLGQDSIRKFQKDRAVCLRRLEERKKEPGCDSLTPVSLFTSIDPDLLEGLIFTGEFPTDCASIKDVQEFSRSRMANKTHS